MIQLTYIASCGNFGSLNFARRTAFNKCGAPSPGGGDVSAGGDHGRGGYNRCGSGGYGGGERGGRGMERNFEGGSVGGSEVLMEMSREEMMVTTAKFIHLLLLVGLEVITLHRTTPMSTYQMGAKVMYPPTSYTGGLGSYPSKYGAATVGYGCGNSDGYCGGGSQGGPPGG